MMQKSSKDQDKPIWRTVHLKLESSRQPGVFKEGDYKGLIVPGHESIMAFPMDGKRWSVVHVDLESGTGKQINYLYRGDTHSIVRDWILQSERKLLKEQEEKRKWEEERPLREAEEARQKHLQWLDLHGPGLYITPLCKIDDSESDENTGNLYGPFQDDDRNGLGGPDEAEALYWSAIHDARHELSSSKPINLIEAASREDALKGIGHVWITNGLEKGPPVDPRQAALPFETGLRQVVPHRQEPSSIEPKLAPRQALRSAPRRLAPVSTVRAAKAQPKRSSTAERMKKLLAKYK